ncbi:MAG TPA: hypothetical protein PK011_11885 [Marinagarivorans sp.]|nr:hypothetical protein [Marinagarivorans sp.]
MTTPCMIATRVEHQSYRFIVCQNDGYDAGKGVGPTLRQFFNSQVLAEELTALGDISGLCEGKVTAYHRDLGERWERNRPRYTYTLEMVRVIAWQSNIAYLYVFEDGHWQRHDILNKPLINTRA